MEGSYDPITLPPDNLAHRRLRYEKPGSEAIGLPFIAVLRNVACARSMDALDERNIVKVSFDKEVAELVGDAEALISVIICGYSKG